ncbi:SIP domain-containing protein [Salinibacterium sp.]|uniref:SIP domain-containing protein n=1 Tax=Salinibacterium sp. TaxID=1915057 RepID=UPI00286CE57C|nr:SIP domain-containing protein [Salinibacterium sp.]
MATPETPTASISWNPSAADRLLLAGDENALETIRVILATLPASARGQVFIEVQSEGDIANLAAPGRFAVCWLVRDRGQSLRRSTNAWLAEMLPVSAFGESTVYSWIAADGAARMLSSN